MRLACQASLERNWIRSCWLSKDLKMCHSRLITSTSLFTLWCNSLMDRLTELGRYPRDLLQRLITDTYSWLVCRILSSSESCSLPDYLRSTCTTAINTQRPTKLSTKKGEPSLLYVISCDTFAENSNWELKLCQPSDLMQTTLKT
jgi:hypothetical protein